jgi:hypothetical protein
MSTSKVDPSTGLSLKEQQIIQKHSSLELLSQVYQTARTAYIEAEIQYNVEYGKWEKSRSSGISKFDQSVVSPHNPSQSKAATEAEEMRDGETAEALLEASAREWQRKVEYAAFDLLGARKRLEEGLEQYAPTQSLSSVSCKSSRVRKR